MERTLDNTDRGELSEQLRNVNKSDRSFQILEKRHRPDIDEMKTSHLDLIEWF